MAVKIFDISDQDFWKKYFQIAKAPFVLAQGTTFFIRITKKHEQTDIEADF